MKLFQSAIFRSLCAIIVGVLLIQYGGDMLHWLTIVIGAIFFATGLVSFIVYHYTKKRFEETQAIFDQDGNEISRSVLSFPIVGIGSMILGAILFFMPNDFNKGIVIVLGLVLVLGGLNQIVSLAKATKFAHVPFLFWIFPLVIFGIGVYSVFNAGSTIDIVMKLIGWCMIFYGLVECIDSLKIYQMRKAYERSNAKAREAAEARAKMQNPEDITDAEVVDNEPTDEPQKDA